MALAVPPVSPAQSCQKQGLNAAVGGGGGGAVGGGVGEDPRGTFYENP